MGSLLQNSGKFVAVTPHDSNNLGGRPVAIYVGGAGNVAMVGTDDVAVTFTGVAAGTVLNVGPKRINSTNTTATAIVALY